MPHDTSDSYMHVNYIDESHMEVTFLVKENSDSQYEPKIKYFCQFLNGN